MKTIKRMLRNKYTTAAALVYAAGCFVAEHVGMSPDYDLQNALLHAAQWTKALALVFGLLMAGDMTEQQVWDYPVAWWKDIAKPLAVAALVIVGVWAVLYGFTKLFNWALPAMFGPKFI